MRRKSYNQYLDKGLTLWIITTAKKNLWRVAAFYDLDDLIQDGYLAFAVCKYRYGHRVENKAHFMSLFKRVYLSIIHDMAKMRTKHVDAGSLDVRLSDISTNDDLTLEYLGPVAEGEAEVMVLYRHLPEEIKALMRDVNDGYYAGRHNRKKRNGQRETNNEFYNRMQGTVGYDYEGTLRQLLYA